MMRPPCGSWLFIMRKACWAQRNDPVRLVDTTSDHCSKVRSSNGMPRVLVPALLNNKSMRPCASLTRSLSLDGRQYNIACGQIDIGNAATTRNEDTARGRWQATGRVEAEPRMDVRDVANGVVYMASLSLEANVQFMTVMATKMPYIGRG